MNRISDIFSLGFGPFRWVCTSGNPTDLAQTDNIATTVLEEISSTVNERVRQQYSDNIRWIREAGKHSMVVGSQARILYSDQRGRVSIALAINRAVAKGRVMAPVVISRDHHDVSGTDSPFRETSNIYDGSAFCADMAVQNVIGDAFRGATWVALHNGGGVGWGEVMNGGFGLVLDGSEEAGKRARVMLNWDVSNGYRDGQRELHCVFVDLEKAYDRVPREELWYCMRKSGVAEKYVRVVQDMYERSRTVVRCAVGQTEEFNVEVGLHQGSALSPFLFAIVMDQLSEEVRQESPWTMMFADDIVICSESREQVEENLERWRFALERRGMKVSRSKTEYMCVNEREGSGTVRLQGEEVKKVQEFKYLGSTVQSNGECGKEVARRCWSGNSNAYETIQRTMEDQRELRVTLPHHVQDEHLLDQALQG
ncbi:hypothetical protein QTP70_028485 [Hemibagrus guttatus]|uniref:ribonuclease H n=1 Tax=Hemibagrus guttatus TaxID=175788 RepID=A0AAE0RLK4_9TELE|nr:hypothetical protein QTP70_028485 [Hemibagrus guttatus]